MRAALAIAVALISVYAAPRAQADDWVATLKQIDPTKADNPGNVALNVDGAGQPCVPSLSSADCKTYTIPQRASGGRVKGLVHAGGDTFYAASEWGGLFRTTDGGQTWARLNGFAPSAAHEVAVDPFDSNRLYATSLYDGAGAPKGAISVSVDAGLKWRRSATGVPPQGFCLNEDEDHISHARDTRRLEQSAFAIAADRDNPGVVYVGTNCGLAKSTDSGKSWVFIDPTPADPADSVWGVIVHNGVVDTCGDDGHRRSSNGGLTWTTFSAGGVDQSTLPGSGRCVIAASPHERDVLFIALGLSLYESVDGGVNWRPLRDLKDGGRFLFVATHQRNAIDFDLYFGNKDLLRLTCRSAPSSIASPISRCGQAASSFVQAGAHRDVADLAFGGNGCPVLYASDGGVYRNSRTGPNCHDPLWVEATTTTRALWTWALTGRKQAGRQELYFGAQDNGFFATDDARAATPVWRAEDCCDVYDAVADSDQALFTRCCEGGNAERLNVILIRPPGAPGPKKLPDTDYPGGDSGGIAKIPHSSDGSVIVNYAKDSFAVVTDKGVFYTTQIDVAPRRWHELGSWNRRPKNFQDIKVGHAGEKPVFYVLASEHTLFHSSIHRKEGRATGKNELFKLVDVGSGQWQPVGGTKSIGVLAVDPANAEHLIASRATTRRRGDEPPGVVNMDELFDGGKTWTRLAALDKLMTAAGQIAYANGSGPVSDVWFLGYAQPTLVKFGPAGTGMIVAGAADLGLFISYDNGANWKTLSAAVPRPRLAYFDRVGPNEVNLFVGSQGRGLWRVNLKRQ